ncbi:hypothetical protein MMEU_4801 [Mycobacterium marinum str. Europe]|nr:hypothetical protein MMEU_4801 [Mycobacterium marinum str. Europe]
MPAASRLVVGTVAAAFAALSAWPMFATSAAAADTASGNTAIDDIAVLSGRHIRSRKFPAR